MKVARAEMRGVVSRALSRDVGIDRDQSLASPPPSQADPLSHGACITLTEHERDRLSSHRSQASALFPEHAHVFRALLERALSSRVAGASQKISAKHLLDFGDTLLTLLPHYPSHADLSPLIGVAQSLEFKSAPFIEFARQHLLLVAHPLYESVRVAHRLLITTGRERGVSATEITRALNDLLGLPCIADPTSTHDLVQFLRGVVLNDWCPRSSLTILKDGLLKQRDPLSALALASNATLATMHREPKLWRRYGAPSVPDFVELLTIAPLSEAEISLANRLFATARPGWDLDSCTRKICMLIECCRFTSQKNSARIFAKLAIELEKPTDPAEIIEIHTINALRLVEDLQMRRSIEGILDASSPDAFKTSVELLRTLFSADVPSLELPEESERGARHRRQLQIFKQALQAFDTFRQVRALIPFLGSELRDLPDGTPSLLGRFADATCTVQKIHEGKGALSGLVMTRFAVDALFQTSPQCPSFPSEAYLATPGWTRRGISDFLQSEVIITSSELIVSVPNDKRYQVGGHDMAAIFYRGTAEDSGGTQCFIIPLATVRDRLAGSLYGFLDLPHEVPGLRSLPDDSLHPEELLLAARKASLPYFDVGSATNIGGHSNALAVLPEDPELALARLDKLFGVERLDPWGNTRKEILLDHPEQFEAHTAIHAKLAEMIAGFGSVVSIFQNRYAAWKKGRTPINKARDDNWGDASESPGLRMLQEAYRWNTQLQFAAADRSQFPKISFLNLSAMHQGPIPGFMLDTADMRLHLPSETKRLPHPRPPASVEECELVVESLYQSQHASRLWQMHVLPHLGELTPVVVHGGII